MERAKTRGLSLFPNHQRIVETAAQMRGLEGNTFSPAIQYIIKDWAELRGVDALIAAPSPAIVDLSDNALESFPTSAALTYWWHVDGVLVEQDGDSTSGTRVASGATAQDAADKVITACTTARGGTWQWATPPTIVRHASQRDDNCPVCKRSFAPAHSYNPELNHED